MPDYSVTMEDDMIVFRSRNSVPKSLTVHPSPTVGYVSGDGYELARAVAPGWYLYFLEREWRDWITEAPRDVDAAFVGFCRKWFEKRGSPR